MLEKSTVFPLLFYYNHMDSLIPKHVLRNQQAIVWFCSRCHQMGCPAKWIQFWKHPIPQRRAQSPGLAPGMPVISLISLDNLTCVSAQQAMILMTTSPGSINLIEWLTKPRETLFFTFTSSFIRDTLKETNSRMKYMRQGLERDGVSELVSLRSWGALPCHVRRLMRCRNLRVESLC